MELELELFPKQLEAFNSPKRFVGCSAGRRGGKSKLGAAKCLTKALEPHSLDKEIWYIAPTYQQGKDIFWPLMKAIASPVLRTQSEHMGTMTFVNGRKFQIKGSDRPDTLVGVGLYHAHMDEYALMKPETWDRIIRPTLADVAGSAMFTGTPRGKNWFYELRTAALLDEDWDWFSWTTLENPYIDPKEVESARRTMSRELFKEEFEASFASHAGSLFQSREIVEEPNEPEGCQFYVAVDPAGYSEEKKVTRSKFQRLDETAIAVVGIHKDGWWVKDIESGRWGIRETSLRILRTAQKCKALSVGIEKGALRNAIMPYLNEQSRRIGVHPYFVECTHGNQAKEQRVMWALQGRFQHGRISFNPGPYLDKFTDQLLDFPNEMAHDDMVDALAYIDQLATVHFGETFEDTWNPLDEAIGY